MKDVSSNWDEVLRLMSSIKTGTVTASLIPKKLANHPRQNGLAKALREIGKIERTLFGLSWYQDLDLRGRVDAGLNKGRPTTPSPAPSSSTAWASSGTAPTRTSRAAPAGSPC